MPFFKMMGHDGQTQEFRRVLNRKTKLARKMSDDDYDVALRFLRWRDYFQKTSLGLPGATGWDRAHRWVDNLEHRPVDEARAYFEDKGISDEPYNPRGQTPGYAVILPRAACWYLGDRGIESGVAYRDFKYQWET